MKKLVRRRAGREERGAAAVELALVMPVLILILFGIINFGALFAQQISISNIAREAARNAVVDGPNSACADIEADAEEGAATLGMAADVPTVVIDPACPSGPTPCAGSDPDQDVTVTVERTGEWLVPFPFFAAPAPTLRAEGVMRCEFS
ncbi:TadE/TadG family type IV pilus assembly protein [Nocardioides sediminis]|uniref:TadE/TadG family type IV pilus assembly protein n=1 Tax=Nocardioides sediminis TaxID=433648 RepID=UPI000D2FAE9B|nr:TadE family protein [Nocardioides sediminis]